MRRLPDSLHVQLWTAGLQPCDDCGDEEGADRPGPSRGPGRPVQGDGRSHWLLLPHGGLPEARRERHR